MAYVQFREVTGLRTPLARVHQSQTDGGQYLVVPTAYQVGRRADDGTEAAHRPLVVLHAAVGTGPDEVEVLFEAGLQPALRPLDVADLTREVRRRDERASLVWPTEVSGVSATFSWAGVAALGARLETTALPGGTLRLGAGVDVAQWMVLRGVLAHGGLAGAATFTFPDGSSVSSSLAVDLRRVVGPWATGPLRVERDGAAVVVSNPTEAPVVLHQLVAHGPDGVVGATAVERTVEAGASTTVEWQPPAGAVVLTDHETVSTGPATVEEIRSFVEEVDVTVVFLHEQPGDQEVAVDARVAGLDEVQRVVLGPDAPAAEVTFPLPLTAALASPAVEYRVAGAPSAAWRRHLLSDSAFVVITDDAQT
ncbi:hypothetical protein [uncultured Pseudokineococcus sp.]|uniref:hypothetical protein n=1 Tax=uncultured Pseudokineococcus sp. TaxID=1642928 RepID=UPI00261F429D|nr:hypothetical protein [uncultured Pseudokineococcus sp.]